MSSKLLSSVLLLFLLLSAGSRAQSLDQVVNFLQYSDHFASAGQPTAEQLELIRDSGFERIIYIAFSTDRNALANEDKLVKDLGMEYVQIPVVWAEPTPADYESFAAVMARDVNKKTLLHCQVNMRASAFAFLYRVLEEGVPMAEAKAAMNAIWEPNDTWRQLIFDVLEANGKPTECEGCDW